MQSFSATDFLNLWEQGTGLHAIDHALLVLRHACPEYAQERLPVLSLGQRDALLLKVRQQIFGDRLEAYSECPSCQERLEFSLSCDALMSGGKIPESLVKTITIEGVEFDLRSPDSRDAAEAAASEDVDAAKRVLLARCAARTNLTESSAGTLPASVQAAIAGQLAAMDPLAEILLDLNCPACAHAWQGVFEIMTFLWTEIRARARRLLQEVDVLARAYGWSEAEIFVMSEARRGLYVQMALA